VSKKGPSSSDARATRVTQLEVGPDGQIVRWPRPVQDGVWVDPDGVAWRMRGGRLDAKTARKLVRRSDIAVAWAYELDVAVLTGPQRHALLARVEAFLKGSPPPFNHFDLGDFRDEEHHQLLVVEESC
jgi:hypothetical protein